MTNAICDNGIAIESIRKARRLGKPPANNTNRPPLLVTLDSEFTKIIFFSRLYKLRDDKTYSNINVSHDMNLEERKRTKILVEQANDAICSQWKPNVKTLGVQSSGPTMG